MLEELIKSHTKNFICQLDTFTPAKVSQHLSQNCHFLSHRYSPSENRMPDPEVWKWDSELTTQYFGQHTQATKIQIWFSTDNIFYSTTLFNVIVIWHPVTKVLWASPISHKLRKWSNYIHPSLVSFLATKMYQHYTFSDLQLAQVTMTTTRPTTNMTRSNLYFPHNYK